MTPQQLRDFIKVTYPQFYGTENHRRNVEKGHYKDLDHALLAQIYVSSRNSGHIVADRTCKPILLTVTAGDGQDIDSPDEDIDTENLAKLESGEGVLYVLGTHLYTKEGKEIIKIGITTGTVENRIAQLYTTGVPFRFRVIKEVPTSNYYELEQSLHKLLDRFRINKSREFFTEACMPFIEQIISVHNQIQSGT